MRSRLMTLFVPAVLAAGVAVAVGDASADAAPACNAGGPQFRGPNGPVSLAIGAPGTTVSGRHGVGAVEIRTACNPSAAPQVITGPGNQSAAFGFSVDIVDLDGDGYTDLVVGMPLYNVGSAVDAGAIAVYYGSATGLSRHTVLTQDSPGVPGAVQAGAHFGSAVLAQPTTNQIEIPMNQVRIGEPGRDVGSAKDAGGWVDLVYTLSGTLEKGTREVTFSTAGVPGTAQRGALLGASLSHDGLVGAPGYPVAGHAGAGAVISGAEFLGIGDHLTLVTQNSGCVVGAAETGDHFGATVAGPWVGAPGEDLGSARDAGLVDNIGGTAAVGGGDQKCYGLTASSTRLGGRPASGDRFGAALSEPDFGFEDEDQYYASTLLIGAPGTDTTAGKDAGRLYYQHEDNDLEFGTFTLAAAQSGHVAGSRPAAHALFGSALAQDTAAVGAPGGTGVVSDYGTTVAARATAATFVPSAAVRSGGYGAALAG